MKQFYFLIGIFLSGLLTVATAQNDLGSFITEPIMTSTNDPVGTALPDIPDDFQNDLWLNTNYREMTVGDTYNIVARRVPEIIDGPITNNITLPPFHYNVARGNSVSVDANGVITANNLGTSIIEVTYDAIQANGQNYGAVSQVNITYMVIDVIDNTNDPGITLSTDISTRSYDTHYFLGDGVNYSFTISANGADNITVTCNDEPAAKNGNLYSVTLKNRANIIEIIATNETGTKKLYYVIDARKIAINIYNISNPNRAIVAGDNVKVAFHGITLPVYKLATIYNPQYESIWGGEYTRVVYENPQLGTLKTNDPNINQYTIADYNSISFSCTETGTYTFSNGHIHEVWWGSPLGTEKDMSGPGQPNLNAPTNESDFSFFPEFSIPVVDHYFASSTRPDYKAADKTVEPGFNTKLDYKKTKSYQTIGLFDIAGGVIYHYDFATHIVHGLNIKTEEEVFTSKPLNPGGTFYPAWVAVDEQNETLYFGSTVSGNKNDRIYKTNLTNGEWEYVTTLACNYDGEVYNGQLYVSGLGYSNWQDPNITQMNSIWLVDQSGSDNHTKLITVPGNSTGFDIANNGNMAIGQYVADGKFAIWQWNDAEIEQAKKDNQVLETNVAAKISSLSDGVCDCVYDNANNLYWNTNSFTNGSKIVKWNGKTGDGNNYEVIATNKGGWLNMLKTTGNVEARNIDMNLYIGGTKEGLSAIHKDVPPEILLNNFAFDYTQSSMSFDLNNILQDVDDDGPISLEVVKNSQPTLITSTIDDEHLIFGLSENKTDQATVTLKATCNGLSNNKVITIDITIPNNIENKDRNSIKFYPIPCHDYFTIKGDNVAGSPYKIYNISGQAIISNRLNSNEQTIDASQLTPGTYIIIIKTEQEVITQKIIKR